MCILPEPYAAISIKNIESIDHFDLRQEITNKIGWHLPTDELLRALKNYEPIVSVGSGLGYTEYLAQKHYGVDIICTDIGGEEFENYHSNALFYIKPKHLTGADAIKKYSNRNIFMAWPPYDTTMALDCAVAIEPGNVLIYVGEHEGGCNGTDEFFYALHNDFERQSSYINIPQWWGIHDSVSIFKKK